MDPITVHYQLNWGQVHDLFKGGGGPIRLPNYTLIYLKLPYFCPKMLGIRK